MSEPKITMLETGSAYRNLTTGATTGPPSSAVRRRLGSLVSWVTGGQASSGTRCFCQRSLVRSRRALPITETLLRLIAPAAIIGSMPPSSTPAIGYKMPAASGTAAVL